MPTTMSRRAIQDDPMATEMRKTGIDIVGYMPWGTHICLFYETKQDLLDTLVAYCIAGLKNEELCLWVVAEPVTINEATDALIDAAPDLDRYMADGSLEVLSSKDWYLQGGTFDLKRVTAGWHERLAGALARGYAGVRVTGDTAWLQKRDWKHFCEYEESLNEAVANQRLAVLCTYPLGGCGALEILDVVRTHQFALARRHGSWDVIETAGLKQAKAEIKRLNEELEQRVEERTSQLRASEERWRKLFENSSAGIALITPDGRCSAANVAFQQMLGYSEQELRRLTTLDLTLEEDRAVDEALRAEASAGQWRANHVERRFRRKDGTVIWTDVSAAFVPAAGRKSAFFAAVIVDIGERERAEEELRRSEAFLAQGQRISHTGSWGWQVATGSNSWSQEHFRIFGCDPETDRPSYSLFTERLHPEDRDRVEELLKRAVRERSDFEFDYRIVLPDGSIKFLRSVGEALVNPAGELEFLGTTMDVTGLKRAEEMELAIAREREMLMRQRATDLAKANEALRSCLDALASVPRLDEFVGQVMAVITRQLGAVSSNLRVLNAEQKGMRIELLFQDGSVISPADASYPERFQSLSLEELGFAPLEAPYTVLNLADPQALEMPSDVRAYLQGQGVKTQLIIPLVSQGHVNGLLSFRFAEERNFQAEELEIARALATQAGLAIHLTELAKSAKQSAVLEERNRLAGEIHDSLAQSFTGITMQLEMAKEIMSAKDDDAFGYVERANDLARFGLAEARRSALSLKPMIIKDSGLIESLQMLVERSNIPGRLRCTFSSNLKDDESLPLVVRQDLVRIAQEAISNSLRHAKSTAISVSLHSDPPNLTLKVKDNGCGIPTAEIREGFGFANMRARVKKLKGSLDIRTAPDRGTSIVVSVPVGFRA
jgi:PAS domain S-box-containing protein